jgi:hypothetical protein
MWEWAAMVGGRLRGPVQVPEANVAECLTALIGLHHGDKLTMSICSCPFDGCWCRCERLLARACFCSWASVHSVENLETQRHSVWLLSEVNPFAGGCQSALLPQMLCSLVLLTMGCPTLDPSADASGYHSGAEELAPAVDKLTPDFQCFSGFEKPALR